MAPDSSAQSDPGASEVPFGELEFRELADNAPVMIWRAGPDKLCDWFNKPWQDFAGKALGELVGYGWADDVHPDDFDRCVSTYVAAFDARESFSMPYRLRRKDGVFRWFLDNGTPFFRQGRFAGYFGSCIDITAQRELQEHQRLLLDELNHRVKNNLQLVISFLHLAKMRAQGDEAKTLMQAAIARIKGVGAIQDELHKSGSGLVDLAEYLPGIARAALRVEGSGGVLTSETQSVHVPFHAASDLGLIVNELVVNALKHGGGGGGGGAGGVVRLRVVKLGPALLEISVSDSGPGFPTLGDADSPATSRQGGGLIAALAKRCKATLTRENRTGAQIRLVMPIPDTDTTPHSMHG